MGGSFKYTIGICIKTNIDDENDISVEEVEKILIEEELSISSEESDQVTKLNMIMWQRTSWLSNRTYLKKLTF